MRHGRSFPIKPHLPPAIVGEPIVIWTAPRAVIVQQQANGAASRIAHGRRLSPTLPPAIIGAAPAPPPAPIATRTYLINQAIYKARQFYGVARLSPTVPPPIVSTSYARSSANSQLVTIRPGIEIDV